MAKAQAITAQSLIVLLIVANTVVRPPYGNDYTYFWGNTYCLLLAGFIPLLLTEKKNLPIAAAVFLTMLHNVADTHFFTLASYGVNDIIATALIMVSFILGSIKTVPHRTAANVLLLLVVPVKLFSANSTAVLNGRYLFAMGDAMVYFLIALYCLLKLKQQYLTIPVLFLAFTFINLEDNLIGDPYHLHGAEIIFMAMVVTNLAWWHLRRWYTKGNGSLRGFIAEAAVMDVLLIATLLLPVWP